MFYSIDFFALSPSLPLLFTRKEEEEEEEDDEDEDDEEEEVEKEESFFVCFRFKCVAFILLFFSI